MSPNEQILIDPSADATEREWALILRLVASGHEVGFGALDSFLSGPDVARRVALVGAEAPLNPALKDQLRDTLSLNQSGDLTAEQLASLRTLI